MDYLDFYNTSYSANNLASSEIRRCWIRTLEHGAYAGTNVLYDKCYIEDATFSGSGTVMLKNSKIKCNSSNSCIYNATAINCNIIFGSSNVYYPLTSISCVLVKGGSNTPSVHGSSASIINSLFAFTPTTSSSLYQHECYHLGNSSDAILDDKLNCTLNLTEAGYLGQDGTVVGVMGGEYPFSENPSMPTVDTDKSSVVYDAENNKLKVSITVKAD